MRQLLQAGNAQIEVLIDGDSGPSIVLLPSSQRDSLDFKDLAQRLADAGFRVLRPQPRGMGRSSEPLPDMTLHTLAADVAWVIERLGGGQAIVAGHAFGVVLAWVVAAEAAGSTFRPDRRPARPGLRRREARVHASARLRHP